MSTYWGVVSTHPANLPPPHVAGYPTLFDVVTQQVKAPQFWGRYLIGKDRKNLLTDDEASFLSSRGCRILLIHYGIQPCGNYQQGQADASNAITAAQTLQIPPGVTLYGDIETRVFAHPDWLLGWWDTMMASPTQTLEASTATPRQRTPCTSILPIVRPSPAGLIRTKAVRCASIPPCLPVTHDPAAPLMDHRTMLPRRIASRIPQGSGSTRSNAHHRMTSMIWI